MIPRGAVVFCSNEVPGPGSDEFMAISILTKVNEAELAKANGLMVGFAAGKAAAKLPTGARIVRVVVVAELPSSTPEGG